MIYPAKDPFDTLTIDFDFSAYAPGVASASVTILRHTGKVDAAPNNFLDGSPQIDSAHVWQNIQGGQDGTTYVVRCEADLLDADGQPAGRKVLTCTIPVVTAQE